MSVDIKKKEYVKVLLRHFFEFCFKRGYSKKKISVICGTNFTAVYRWIREESVPRSPAIIERIENFLRQSLAKEPAAAAPVAENLEQEQKI